MPFMTGLCNTFAGGLTVCGSIALLDGQITWALAAAALAVVWVLMGQVAKQPPRQDS